jgi:tRNA (cmo5U34)-methyltransferase
VDWSEGDSREYLSRADQVTPSRGEVMDLIAALAPGGPALELCCGAGDLGARLLAAFPGLDYLGLDGSAVMLEAARRRLGPRVRPFRLEAADWRQGLHGHGSIVSMLGLHHLDGAGKRRLFADLLPALRPGGMLLVFDLVLPESKRAQRAFADAWDWVVRSQGGPSPHPDNIYRHPDPMDTPDSLFAQLTWLQAAGYADVDCFWQRAGHALYGGYRPSGA